MGNLSPKKFQFLSQKFGSQKKVSVRISKKSVLKFWPLSSVVMKTLFSFFRLLCIFFLEPTECIFYVDGQEDVGAKTWNYSERLWCWCLRQGSSSFLATCLELRKLCQKGTRNVSKTFPWFIKPDDADDLIFSHALMQMFLSVKMVCIKLKMASEQSWTKHCSLVDSEQNHGQQHSTWALLSSIPPPIFLGSNYSQLLSWACFTKSQDIKDTYILLHFIDHIDQLCMS